MYVTRGVARNLVRGGGGRWGGNNEENFHDVEKMSVLKKLLKLKKNI